MIKITNLQKRFDDLEVLRDVNIDVAEGEVVCIYVSSGLQDQEKVHFSGASTSWKYLQREKLNTMEKVSQMEK